MVGRVVIRGEDFGRKGNDIRAAGVGGDRQIRLLLVTDCQLRTQNCRTESSLVGPSCRAS